MTIARLRCGAHATQWWPVCCSGGVLRDHERCLYTGSTAVARPGLTLEFLVPLASRCLRPARGSMRCWRWRQPPACKSWSLPGPVSDCSAVGHGLGCLSAALVCVHPAQPRRRGFLPYFVSALAMGTLWPSASLPVAGRSSARPAVGPSLGWAVLGGVRGLRRAYAADMTGRLRYLPARFFASYDHPPGSCRSRASSSWQQLLADTISGIACRSSPTPCGRAARRQSPSAVPLAGTRRVRVGAHPCDGRGIVTVGFKGVALRLAWSWPLAWRPGGRSVTRSVRCSSGSRCACHAALSTGHRNTSLDRIGGG
jgi:hypothetical protein